MVLFFFPWFCMIFRRNLAIRYDNFNLAAETVLGKQVNIVIDRFHVSQLYREALDKLRSIELKRLNAILSDEEY
jgi:hypothetical protein